MKILGNIIWLVFGGIQIAAEYFVASFFMMITIVGIPFALQTFKLGVFALWPFGQSVVYTGGVSGCLSTIMNIIWFFVGGFWIFLTHLVFGAIFFITIIGIPFALQHFKMAGLALAPFGRDVVSS